MTAPEPSLNAKRTSGSDYFLCVGYAAIAEIVVAMIAAGALLDSPYGTSRPNYKQHAHESIWGIVELVFAPGHWASDILDTSNQGTMVTCIRLVAMLAAPAVVWGTGLFALRAGFRRLERSDDRLDAHVSTVTNDSGGTD